MAELKQIEVIMRINFAGTDGKQICVHAEKVGRWKYETMKHIITGEMRTVRICSECDGGWFRYDMSDGVEDAEPNYCPNCGAKMRGEEDG